MRPPRLAAVPGAQQSRGPGGHLVLLRQPRCRAAWRTPLRVGLSAPGPGGALWFVLNN